MFKIGSHQIDSPVLLAPMAGVTDLPFRRLCRRYGAGLTTSEMVTSDTRMWSSRKSSTRLVIEKQNYPVSMQIAGSDAAQLAEAARACVDHGAEIVDINMGCPAKKVCKKAAGSALLADEKLVKEILTSVVAAVDVPVTLKTRTGTDASNKNGVRVARIAEDAGIAALAIHGRTRACKFNGHAEYDTIAKIADTVTIPVMANGDIDSPQKAQSVLKATGVAGILIGRAAFGQPWLFAEIKHALSDKCSPWGPLNLEQKCAVVIEHIENLHAFYGEQQGVRIARKHFGWYCDALAKVFVNHAVINRAHDITNDLYEQDLVREIELDAKKASRTFNTLGESRAQIGHIKDYFYRLKTHEEKAA